MNWNLRGRRDLSRGGRLSSLYFPGRVALSRRRLLQSLGAGTALAPLFPILNATGQETLFPKRLVLFYSPDGTAAIDDGGAGTDWSPTGTETDFTLAYIHEPLTPWRSKIVVPFGLRMSAGGAGQEHAYGMSGLWSGASLHEPHDDANFDGGNGLRTGWGSGPTIDQVVARASGTATPYQSPPDASVPETPYRTIELGVQTGDPHSMHRMIYRGDKQPVHPEVSPQAAFNRLFGDFAGGGEETTGPDPAKQAQLDILMRETNRLRNKVGTEEYVKVDRHLEGLDAIQQRLNSMTTTVGGICSAPTGEMPAPRSQWENSDTFPTEAKAMADIVGHALACDLTRVASIQLSRGFSNLVHEWVGSTQGHHTVSHLNGDHRAELQAIDRYYAEQFAYLLEVLDSFPEGDGTLLDNTLVVWGREMGQTNHRMQPVNLILAGGARGELTTGRFYSFNNEPHAKLLVSMGQMMGLEIDSFGDRNPDSGPLAI